MSFCREIKTSDNKYNLTLVQRRRDVGFEVIISSPSGFDYTYLKFTPDEIEKVIHAFRELKEYIHSGQMRDVNLYVGMPCEGLTTIKGDEDIVDIQSNTGRLSSDFPLFVKTKRKSDDMIFENNYKEGGYFSDRGTSIYDIIYKNEVNNG